MFCRTPAGFAGWSAALAGVTTARRSTGCRIGPAAKRNRPRRTGSTGARGSVRVEKTRTLPDLAEQAQQDGARLVGDAQGLDTKLLLGLQGRQAGAFLGQIGVDQVANPGF